MNSLAFASIRELKAQLSAKELSSAELIRSEKPRMSQYKTTAFVIFDNIDWHE